VRLRIRRHWPLGQSLGRRASSVRRMRGYVSDPDGNIWEIAWNPAWKIDAKGYVTFGV